MSDLINNIRGFTLIELMVAMVIASILMLAVVSTHHHQLRSHLTQQSMVDMHQNARAALHLMKQDIQMAGFDPTKRANATVLVATANDFQFQIDANEDGDCGDPNEIIRFTLNNGDLRRATGAGGPLMPMAENVDAIDFVYYDEDMNAIVPTPGNTSELDAIRLVQVSLVARADDPAMAFKHPNTSTYTNQVGATIFGPVNDTSRRALLSSNIWCRNMGR